MKQKWWRITLGITLISLSAIFYYIHFLIFGDLHHILIYLVGDIAFVPIEVLIVTLIIHKFLEERELKSRLEKLNMVIETFFSKVGTELLTLFSDFDPELDSIKQKLVVRDSWTKKEFANMRKELKGYSYSVTVQKIDLYRLRDFLTGNRDFLLQLLANPTMLEHETFTDLIRAVLHLTEELLHRENIKELTDRDRDHLAGDMKRAYGLLVKEWLECMKYLKSSYPYLFSLAMRTNPFDSEASVSVR